MTHVFDVVKLGLTSTSSRSFAKRLNLAVLMTTARMLRSRMKLKFQVRVRHEARSSRGINPLSTIGE